MKASLMNKSLVVKNEVFEKEDIVEIYYGEVTRRKVITGRIMGFAETSDGDILIKVDTSTLYNSRIELVVVEDITKMRRVFKEA